jgi:hypothetical protein
MPDGVYDHDDCESKEISSIFILDCNFAFNITWDEHFHFYSLSNQKSFNDF